MSDNIKPLVSPLQLDNMLHALGGTRSSDRSKLGWRNHYALHEPSPLWEDLVSKGLATRHEYPLSGCKFVYRVSKEGLALLGVQEGGE